MTNILIIGAGRSSIYLIEYLLQHARANNWQLTVADVDIRFAEEKIQQHPCARAISFDIKKEEERQQLIRDHDFVISMLPAFMHGDVARDCVEIGRHLATASYASAEMKAFDSVAKQKKLLLLNECGLDPGIDHASAMKVINGIRKQGGKLTSFKSYCGGLVAPESNTNPWGYKFSWNPRNVVLAGQGTAQYMHRGEIKYIPHNRLFLQTETVEVEGCGRFDAYANRDSIAYIDIYGLQGIQTMLRGTLRQHGYCKAWNTLVSLGLTDDSSKIAHAGGFTCSKLVDAFLPPGAGSLKERLRQFAGVNWNTQTEEMIDYLELFSDKKISLHSGSPAQVLQALLEEKWRLEEGDKDMVVMQHEFEYILENNPLRVQKLNSSLVVKGRNSHYTAMALTVGLPLAICVKNFLCKAFELYGVQLPTVSEIYEPMLAELIEHGVVFNET